VVLTVDDAGNALREWIRSHRVTWERRPHFELRGTRLVRTGYDVTLFARHPPTGAGCPGCAECRRIHDDLRRVADAALPSHGPTTGVAFGPFAPELTMRAESGWDPEVELDVEVYQPGGVAPSDDDEAACVAGFESGLHRLGARQGTWATR
jgi:hypothetical protein